MPILIAVDVSLSMHPYLNAKNETESFNVVSLVKNLITRLESYLYREYIALAYLGEEMSIVVDFTKEYQPLVRIVEKSLSSTSANINFSDCCFQTIQFCQGCYSSLDLSQILIITHSKVAVNTLNLHLKDENSTLSRTLRANNLPISLVLFDNPKHSNMEKTNEIIERFLSENLAGGNLYHTEYKSSNWRRTLDKLFDENFRPLCATLALGSLKSDVHITPRILSLDLKSDPNTVDESTKVSMQIFGFAKLSDLSNPVTVSRHLITARATAFRGGEANFPLETMKTPNFCALLHGALKTSDCIALCAIAETRFGFVTHFSDGKKSNLTLSMFELGVAPMTWIDSFDKIKYQTYIPPGCPPSLVPVVKPTIENEYKPSYSSGSPSWILNYGLHVHNKNILMHYLGHELYRIFQSDLQKLVRCLKRLPERDTLFYAELNRIISHALAIGFVELLQLIKEAFVEEKSSGLTDIQISHIDYIVGKLESDDRKTTYRYRDGEKKLGKIITPDPWKSGARSTTGGGGRQLGENKALTANKNRFNPYQASTTFKKCRICRSVVHQAGSHYCQGCAYKKGICAMCGKKMLDTKNYRQSAV